MKPSAISPPQAGKRRAMDQGRQAGGEDDTAARPPIPLQRGAALAERHYLQPGESVAATGTAGQDRQLVADESGAAVGENRWQAGEARAVLLAAAGGEPVDAEAFWRHAAQDRGAAGNSG